MTLPAEETTNILDNGFFTAVSGVFVMCNKNFQGYYVFLFGISGCPLVRLISRCSGWPKPSFPKVHEQHIAQAMESPAGVIAGPGGLPNAMGEAMQGPM